MPSLARFRMAQHVRNAVLLTLGLLALAFLLKDPCLHHPWDGAQYEMVCYSDIYALYYVRGLSDGIMPYVDGFSEYPVLTGMWMWTAAKLGGDAEGYMRWNMALLGLAAVAVTVMLGRMARADRLWVWAAAPSLALSAFLNLDLLAVGFATLGILLHRQARDAWSGIAFGLGAAAKLYPGFLVPLFVVAAWRLRGRKAAVATLLGAGLAWFAVQAPILIAAPAGWWATYTFHSGRAQEWETLWMILVHVRDRMGWDWLQAFTEPSFMGNLAYVSLAAAIAFGSWSVFRGWTEPVAASLIVLMVFFVTNPVFNAQYVLWVLPLLVLVDVPRGWIALLFVADVGVHLTKFHLFLHFGSPLYDDHFELFALAVVARVVAFLGILVFVARAPWARFVAGLETRLRRPGSVEGG